MRIGVMDDDEAQAARVADLLTSFGHNCAVYHSGKAMLTALRQETFDLLVLDWNVPDVNGVKVLASVRQQHEDHLPILMLTNRSDEADIVSALGAGADDYVVKPVPGAVLGARVNALLRRSYPPDNKGGQEIFENFRFERATECVWIEQTCVQLTSKEFSLALLLFRNLYRALSRGYILEAVWGRNPDLPTRTLDQHVSRVRTKLGLRPHNGYRLATVYSYGYRLEKLLPQERFAAEEISE